MEALNQTSNCVSASTTCPPNDAEEPFVTDSTLTFIIGFGILILFIILGILASAFLCFTLRKGPYLWDVEQERQFQEKLGELTPTENMRSEICVQQQSTQL